ncbi:MAG: hypothetical protein LBV04_03650 [Deferribacteraceae bacterium]|jgi:hypothetical protein|nr:hypothetical protein [Deferribacteraceae bacterium]
MNIKDELARCYNLQKFFTALPERFPVGENLLLEEFVTGAEDAWLNSLVAAANPDHIRYHRAEDIIAAAGADFTLISYKRKAEQLSFSLLDGSAIKEQLASLPADIANIIKPKLSEPELSETTLTLTVHRGSFHWSFRRGL